MLTDYLNSYHCCNHCCCFVSHYCDGQGVNKIK